MDRLITTFTSLAVVDGEAAWADVVGGIRRTLEDPFRGLPVLGLLLLAVAVAWANVRVARWLTPSKQPRPEHGTSR